MNSYVDLESQMTAFERVRFYATKLPQEKENVQVFYFLLILILISSFFFSSTFRSPHLLRGHQKDKLNSHM
jgi:hypothetical protein